MEDQELKAMSDVIGVLSSLDADAKGRVLRWVAERTGVSVPRSGERGKGSDSSAAESADSPDAGSFKNLPDLFTAAAPRTDSDRLLVAGFWFQVNSGQAELDSQSLNTALKDLGHGLSHVNRNVEELRNAKPSLMVQLKRDGTSQQARKKFKLTAEGIKKVRAMIAGSET